MKETFLILGIMLSSLLITAQGVFDNSETVKFPVVTSLPASPATGLGVFINGYVLIYDGSVWDTVYVSGITNITADTITIEGATPILQFKDTDATAGDVNATFKVTATDTGDGTEDIDVQLEQQVAGTLARWIFSDADQGIYLYPLGEAANPVSITTGGALDAPSITVNSVYTFPTTDGSANQVIKTDGAGTLSWVASNSVNGVLGVDATNPSAVKLFRVNDTITESFGHEHTEYFLTTGGTISGDLTVTGSITGAIISPKAYAYLDSNAVATSLTADTWAIINNFTEGGETGGVTFNSDTIHITTTGTYELKFDPSAAKAAGGSAYIEIGFSINGADPLGRYKTGRQFSSSDVGFGAMIRTAMLSAGDYVVLKARNSTNSDDITFRYGEFEITKE